MRPRSVFEKISIGIVFAWLSVFAIIPFLFVFVLSFVQHKPGTILHFSFTLSNYKQLLNPLYLIVLEKSLLIAGMCTLLCLLLGYPFAYMLARMQSRYKTILLVLIIIPFWTSSLIRSYAMVAILKAKGLINSTLLFLGLIDTPLQLLFTNTAVLIGLVYNLLPFMILPLYANLERLDQQLLEAAQDLGASRRILFQKVVLPLSMPGIIAGSTLVFLPAMTLFYITDLLGGAKSLLMGNLIRNTFMQTQNWPLGAAMSVLLIAVMAVLLSLYWRTQHNGNRQEVL